MLSCLLSCAPGLIMCASLSQHCHHHFFHSAPSLPRRCVSFRCHSAVLIFAVTMPCTWVSNRCGLPPVYPHPHHHILKKTGCGTFQGWLVTTTFRIPCMCPSQALGKTNPFRQSQRLSNLKAKHLFN